MSDIREIAEKYLQKVKPSGAGNIRALCPFHTRADGVPETRGTFSMNMQSGLYHCFYCHEGGNLEMFLRAVGMSRVVIERTYRDLIEEARTYSTGRTDPSRPKPESERNSEIPDELLGLFDMCPNKLVEEGFPEGLLQKLEIGFDPEHARITYPLRDLKGRLVGISGRLVGEEKSYSPRYKVYDSEYKKWGLPQHKTFKSQLLWNGHRVLPLTIFNSRMPVIVVEGFKACMRVIQAGYGNVVATIGSSISIDQQWLLEGLASEIWLMYDNNDAGFKGTVFGGMRMGLPTRLVPYDSEQPSDLTVEQLQLALSRPVDFHRWFLASTSAQKLWQERRNAKKKKNDDYDY